MAHDLLEFDKKSNTLFCKGKWTLPHVAKLIKLFKKQVKPEKNEIIIDGKEIERLDSAGAFLLLNALQSKDKHKIKITFQNFSEQYQKLLSLMQSKEPYKKPPKPVELNWIQVLGKYSIFQMKEFYQFIGFIGELVLTGMQIIFSPGLWRINSITSIINKAGAQALPIIALLSFTIGVVISYQMGTQLREYGADVFIVNLLGLSILREFGPLLTAIMVGGRTGSSFTAQLGIMRINQEIDALKTMGFNPVQLLLLPKLTGLFIVVPLLAIWADIFGIIGGMIMAQYLLDISWYDFLLRFQQEIPLRALIIGLAKAPVYALIIACVGCFEGMKVRGSAESVGTRTTRSVVLAIFFIIVFDGIVSVLLSRYKL